jgi:hypothetical protein
MRSTTIGSPTARPSAPAPAAPDHLGWRMLVLLVVASLWSGCGEAGGSATADAVATAEDGSAPTWGPADLGCKPSNAPMPTTASAYAALCEAHGLGVPPKIACEDGVQVPITVDGKEVFEAPASCDHSSMLKPICDVGSQIQRIQGKDKAGNPLPDVVWIAFCRATGKTELSSVQMIGHHTATGATCFFEANEGKNSILPERLGRDATNGLTAKLPGPEEADFDRAFVPAPVQCVQCHQNNAWIRNPWLDGARLPENPNEPVLPSAGAASPYYVVGGGDWDMRTIHIEGNACLGCHRIGMEIDQVFLANGFDVNAYMPPHAPGSLKADYQALLTCWLQGPENTPGCDWIIPPAGDCKGGVVGPDYPHAAATFNKGAKAGGGGGDGCYEGCIAKGESEATCKAACGAGGGKGDGKDP